MKSGLEARVAALEKRVRTLEDELEIHRVIVSYGLAVDVGDAARTAAGFSEDGIYDVDGRADMVGRRAIRGMVLGSGHQSLLPNCAHTIGPAVVKVKGNRATAAGYSRIYRRTGNEFRLFRLSMNRWELERRDGRWQVKRRRTTLLGNPGAQGLFKAGLRDLER